MRLQFAERRRLIFSEWRFHVTEMCVTCDPIYIPSSHFARAAGAHRASGVRRADFSDITSRMFDRGRHECQQCPPESSRVSQELHAADPDLPVSGGAWQDLRSERLQQIRDAGPPAEGSVQVGDLDHRAFQAARPGRCRRRRLGDEGLGDGKRCDTLRTRLLPAHRADSREARQLPRTGRRRFLDSRVRGEDPRPGRAWCFQLPRRWSIRSTS